MKTVDTAAAKYSDRSKQQGVRPERPRQADSLGKKLSDDIVKSSPPPSTGSVTIWDAGVGRVTGFGVRIFAPTASNPEGYRSFFLNYRIDGRERRYKIGRYPEWSVSAARKEAEMLRKRIDKNEDPTGEKRARREAATVANLIERYLAEHLPLLAPREHQNQKRMLERISEHLGNNTKVADVNFGDIQAMHRRITGSGHPARANRILAVASKMFSLALRPRAGENEPWRNAVKGNPCRGVQRNHEEAKERFLGTVELAVLSDALAVHDKRSKTSADCVRLIMFTGCRPGEAMRARWQDFDAEPGFWVKASAHTKQRRQHRAPLAPAALLLIDEIKTARSRIAKKAPASPWVFPGEVPGEPIKQLWAVWHAVRDHSSVAIWTASKDAAVAGVIADLRIALGRDPTVPECRAEAARRFVDLPTALMDARLYDLRHSFASIGAGGGLSLEIIGRLLGHTQARTTQRYAHLADDPLREAVDKIGAVIAGAGKVGAKVLPMKHGRGS